MKNTLKAYLLNNMETTRGLIQEINCWNGALECLDYIDMELFNEYMMDSEPIWIAERIFYGDFNPNDDYFQFNAYGNLVSYDLWDVNAEIEDYIEEVIDALVEYKDHIDMDTEILAMVEVLAEQEEGQAE